GADDQGVTSHGACPWDGRFLKSPKRKASAAKHKSRLMHPSLAASAKNAVPLHAVAAKDARAWLARQKRSRLVAAAGFAGVFGALAALPDAKGGIAAWVMGLGDSKDAFALAAA